MSMMSKLAGLAQKALDKSGSNGSAPASGSAPGQTDWRAMVRSAADAITGDGRDGAGTHAPARVPTQGATPVASARTTLDPADKAAIARYDYLLQTADPHQVEQVHREAFERLTPVQRELVQQRMNAELPAHERPRSAGADDLARTAARTEAMRPGSLRGLLSRASASGAGGGRGALLGGAAAGAGIAAGGVLAAVAGGAVLSSVAAPLLEQAAGLGVDFEALAGNLDLGAVEGLTGGVDELAASAGETVSGVGEQLGGFGSVLDDFLGR